MVEWLFILCRQAWKHGVVPDDWTKVITVPLCNGKGNRDECSSYRGVSLLSALGKVYRRVLTERLVRETERQLSEGQGGLTKERGCTDQIFVITMTVRKYLRRWEVVCCIHGYTKHLKGYRGALWDVQQIYGT